jgi:hypothetical protein
MDNKSKATNVENQNKNFGEIDLKIHFSLGAGLAEQLGDDLERAVLEAVSKIGGPKDQFVFGGARIRMDTFWHQVSTKACFHPSRSLSVHLSNQEEGNVLMSRDWNFIDLGC